MVDRKSGRWNVSVENSAKWKSTISFFQMILNDGLILNENQTFYIQNFLFRSDLNFSEENYV